MRKIGWIGGGTFAAAGIIAGLAVYLVDPICNGDEAVYVATAGVGAGLVWALSFNLHAYSLQKKARQSQVYSAPIIEGDVMNLGNSKLTAGVSVMGNQYTHAKGLGMSLKLNF